MLAAVMLKETGRHPRLLQTLFENNYSKLTTRATSLLRFLSSGRVTFIICLFVCFQPVGEGILVLCSHFLSVGMKGQLWHVLKLFFYLQLCDGVTPGKRDY